MKHVCLGVMVLALMLAGCAPRSVQLGSEHVDPETGKAERLVYSRVFDGQAEIVPETVALYALMELDEKKVSRLHGLQQSLGALGPDDMLAVGRLAFIFYNRTDAPVELTLQEFGLPNMTLSADPVALVLPPGKAVMHKSEPFGTSWYSTEFPLQFRFEYTGRTGGGILTLQRKTVAEWAELQQQLAGTTL